MRNIENQGIRERVLVGLLMVVGSLVVSGSVVSGQIYSCGPGWIGDTVTMGVLLDCGGGQVPRTVVVHYCYPAPTGPVVPKTQYIIRAMTGLTDSCIITGMAMRELGKQFIEKNPRNYPCLVQCNPWCNLNPDSCCPSLYPEWRSSWKSCFRTIRHPVDTTTFMSIACEVSGVCIDAYHVCCDGQGKLQAHLAGSVFTEQCMAGTSPVYGCYPVCSSPGSGPFHKPCDTLHPLKTAPSDSPLRDGEQVDPANPVPEKSAPSGVPELTLRKDEE